MAQLELTLETSPWIEKGFSSSLKYPNSQLSRCCTVSESGTGFSRVSPTEVSIQGKVPDNAYTET